MLVKRSPWADTRVRSTASLFFHRLFTHQVQLTHNKQWRPVHGSSTMHAMQAHGPLLLPGIEQTTATVKAGQHNRHQRGYHHLTLQTYCTVICEERLHGAGSVSCVLISTNAEHAAGVTRRPLCAFPRSSTYRREPVAAPPESILAYVKQRRSRKFLQAQAQVDYGSRWLSQN